MKSSQAVVRLSLMPYDGPMTYSRREGGRSGVVVMTLIGPLTLRNIFDFQKEIAVDPPAAMVFDLSQVEYMDSAGLGVLVNYYVSAQRNGRRMTLAGVSERIDALLEMTKVKDLLKSYPTVEAAENSLAE